MFRSSVLSLLVAVPACMTSASEKSDLAEVGATQYVDVIDFGGISTWSAAGTDDPIQRPLPGVTATAYDALTGCLP
jgi:hypothetical protein